MPKRFIETNFYRVVYFDWNAVNPAERYEILIANSYDSSYTIFDIGNRVKEWFADQGLECHIVAIKELDSSGFAIFDDTSASMT